MPHLLESVKHMIGRNQNFDNPTSQLGAPLGALRPRPTIPPSNISPPIDYLALLGLDETATDADITAAWRRLVLRHHPDKADVVTPAERGTQQDEVDIVSLNEARAILGDPVRRREWEAARRGPHIFREISLELFTPHYPSAPTPTSSSSPPNPTDPPAPSRIAPAPTSCDSADATEDEEPEYYTYPCRCSALFRITADQLEQGVNVVGCEGCGEWIKVGYEVVDESEQGDVE